MLGKLRFFRHAARAAAMLGAAVTTLTALAAQSARAGEPDGAPTLVRLTHGDASVETTIAALGLTAELTASGAVATVHWDPTQFSAECAALAEPLSLVPPFDGDLDIGDDAVEAVYPVSGETVDCTALATLLEHHIAAGGAWDIDVPVAMREAAVSADAIDTLAASVRALLAAPVTLAVTFEGTIAGEVTLSPDDLRAALHVSIAGEPPRPVATLDPEALKEQFAAVLARLGEPAENARFDIDESGRAHVVPGRPGVRIDAASLFAAAADAAKKPDKKATVAAGKGEPALSTKKADAAQIKNLVASFTTKHPCCQPRVANIHRAANLLDGAIVEAGERFSLNRHIGKRTKKRGFVMAPSIGEGEFIDTFGGGVSQLATTFYNAVFDGGYAVVSRKPHTFYFPRYPMGVEATLSWPRPDFVFRNDSKSGVLVRASFTDESVTVKLYGDNEGRKVKRFLSKTFAPTDPRTDYEPDETLPLDKPKVKDPGTKGFSVNAGRDIVFADGTKKHEERKVIYHGKPHVVVTHPCAIPKGEKGRRKKGCPKPDETADEKDAVAPLATKAADKASAKAGDKVSAKANDKSSIGRTDDKAPAKTDDTASAKTDDKVSIGRTDDKASARADDTAVATDKKDDVVAKDKPAVVTDDVAAKDDSAGKTKKAASPAKKDAAGSKSGKAPDKDKKKAGGKDKKKTARKT